jgi:hypothetical protein
LAAVGEVLGADLGELVEGDVSTKSAVADPGRGTARRMRADSCFLPTRMLGSAVRPPMNPTLVGFPLDLDEDLAPFGSLSRVRWRRCSAIASGVVGRGAGPRPVVVFMRFSFEKVRGGVGALSTVRTTAGPWRSPTT